MGKTKESPSSLVREHSVLSLPRSPSTHPPTHPPYSYIVSRAGMEVILDLYFTDRTASGMIKPIVKGRDLVVSG